jgi:hypothetical protein
MVLACEAARARRTLPDHRAPQIRRAEPLPQDSGRFVISVDRHVISVASRVTTIGSPWKLGVSSRLEAIFGPSRIQN